MASEDECPCCSEGYNDSQHLPKLLPGCRHTICLSCVEKASSVGRIECPYDKDVYTLNTVEDAHKLDTDHALLKQLSLKEMHCRVHSARALFFCKVHLEALCGQCPGGGSDCDLLQLPSQSEAIRLCLIPLLNQRPYGPCPNDICSSAKKNPSKAPLDALLLAVLWSWEELPPCTCGAEGSSLEMNEVNCLRADHGQWTKVGLEVCCRYCMAQPEVTAAGLKDFEVGPAFKEAVISHIQKAFRWIHFHDFPISQRKLLTTPASDLALQYPTLRQLFAEASILLPLQGNAVCPYPDLLYCLACGKQASKCDLRLRRLPCTNVTHAACEDCLLRSQLTVQCPFDKAEFASQVQDLQPILSRNTVFSGHLLAGKGRLMPVFPSKGNYRSAERFVDLLPSRSALNIEPNDPCAPFNQPWKANSLSNQVECLTFRPLQPVLLWGFGVGSRLKGSAKACIGSVYLYRCDRATGPSGESVPLQRFELGEEPELCSDVYFQEGVAVGREEVVTLKVQIAQEKGLVRLFHGNHIGAYEACLGADGAEFQLFPTKSVDSGEHLAGSESLNPLLRLIYVISA